MNCKLYANNEYCILLYLVRCIRVYGVYETRIVLTVFFTEPRVSICVRFCRISVSIDETGFECTGSDVERVAQCRVDYR